jgi:two-component system, NtrC family, nitrogen regulation sensor histidine kinase NtrY
MAERRLELKGRKRYLALGLFLILAVLIVWQVSFTVAVRPSRSEETILLFVLSTVVALTFLVFGFILSRNIIKLFVERRANLLGSKFKTKLVLGALALSLLPVTLLFYSSYVLMNRAVQRWFTQPFASMERQARSIVAEVGSYAERETEADAIAISRGPMGDALRAGTLDKIRELLPLEAQLEGVDYLGVEINTGSLGFYSTSGSDIGPDLAKELPLTDRRTRRPLHLQASAGGGDYAVAIIPIDSVRAAPNPAGWVIAANRLPDNLTKSLAEMARDEENYNQLWYQNKSMRNFFILEMALVTVLLLVASTWVALFLSKQITIPIAALAEATEQVGIGNLGHRIKVQAADELGVLVGSFNDMVTQLEESRVELERRRRETEALLESIPTPVISLSRDRRVVRVNPAVERLFGPQRAAALTLRELLPLEELRDVDHLLRRSLRQGLATAQLDLTTPRGKLSVAMTVSALQSGHITAPISSDIAYIVVVEDLSDLIHAQQAAAWQEVTRRVAHEIKNPLTPIALSAERIRRRLDSAGENDESESFRVISDCSNLITQEVGTLKTLVDEFSQMARFPKAELKPASLNAIVDSALAVFDGRLDGIHVRVDLAADLPPVNVDADQIKRVVVNLVDNAAEAMGASMFRELRISTSRVSTDSKPLGAEAVETKTPASNGGEPRDLAASEWRGDAVELAVADTGPGVDAETKAKLFLPHFSTKKRGSGLGLAIVNRIVADHRGTIRIEENSPVGARFILELPV